MSSDALRSSSFESFLGSQGMSGFRKRGWLWVKICRAPGSPARQAWRAGDPGARQIFTHSHPRFLNPDIPWLPRKLSNDELRSASLDIADAQLALARWNLHERFHRRVTRN